MDDVRVSAPLFRTALVFGSTGGLGGALVETIVQRGGYARVFALSRSGSAADAGAQGIEVDITVETSVEAAVSRAAGEIDLAIVATGRLLGEGTAPERSFAALDPTTLATSFQVNAIGPAIVAKHVLPRLPRDRRAVFAVLSARVGSIEDNRLGGWYGYRASKAALNMLVRCLAVEVARTRPLAVCVALHPGTVDTALSRPFQRNVSADRLLTPEDSAERLLKVVDSLTPKDSGGFYAYDGTRIPF